MEPVNFHLPGYRINEYLLVIKPQEELWQKIIKLKQEFAGKYQMPMAKYLKPHIALVNFMVLDMMEEKVVNRLQTISMGIAPFNIELKDFGSYPSHTVFINVVSKPPVQQIVKRLKDMQRLMKLNQENKPHYIDEPHIAIARKLKPWQYERGWLEYSNRQFTGRFIADNMLLLRRTAGEKTGFQIVKRFEFMNLPVTTRQASLFQPPAPRLPSHA